MRFGELIGFDVAGATVKTCKVKEVDTIVRMVNGNREIDLILNNNGKFDNYSFQINDPTE